MKAEKYFQKAEKISYITIRYVNKPLRLTRARSYSSTWGETPARFLYSCLHFGRQNKVFLISKSKKVRKWVHSLPCRHSRYALFCNPCPVHQIRFDLIKHSNAKMCCFSCRRTPMSGFRCPIPRSHHWIFPPGLEKWQIFAFNIIGDLTIANIGIAHHVDRLGNQWDQGQRRNFRKFQVFGRHFAFWEVSF